MMSKCCCCDSARCDCTLFSSNPNVFDTSQWGSELKVATWYMVYKVLLASLFVAVVTTEAYFNPQGIKWLIYLTNQGVSLLTINYVIDACLVFSRWSWEKSHRDRLFHHRSEINWLYKLSWVFSTTTFDLALLITIVYWTALYKYVVAEHLLTTRLANYLNFFVHGFNSISCLVDTWLSRRPIKALHFYMAMVYGACYAIFSLVYWATGGLGSCVAVSSGLAMDPDITRQVIVQGDDGQLFDCALYIYPILDWGGSPEIATLTLVITAVLLPIVHFLWFGLVQLRTAIFNCTLGRQRPPEELPWPLDPPNYERPLLMEQPRNYKTQLD